MAASSLTGPSSSVENLAEMQHQDESSESEPETDPTKSFHRRISTNKELKSTVSDRNSVGKLSCVCAVPSTRAVLSPWTLVYRRGSRAHGLRADSRWGSEI